MMKTKNAFTWSRLMRTMVCLLLVLSMLLCACAKTDDDETKAEEQNQIVFGDGDGKLEAQDAVDSLTNLYGALLGAFGGNQPDSYGYEMDLVVTLGQEVLEGVSQSFQQSGINSDASWLREIGLRMEMNYSGDLTQTIVDAQLSGKTIISADVIVDMVGGMGYVGVPAIHNQYMGTQMDMSQMSGGNAMLEEYAGLVKDLPTDKELNTLLTRYLNVVLETLNDPTTGETELSTGGITKKVTTTTYSFTQYNVMDIATEILTTAKTDGELEKVLDAFTKVVNEQGAKQAADQGYTWTDVDLHAEMLESIDPALEDIQEAKQNAEDLELARLVIYTDGDDQVGGMVQVNSGYALVDYLNFFSLEDGDQTALFVNVMGTVYVTGTGEKTGSKFSGEYVLSNLGGALAYVEIEDFDTQALKKGELDGTLRLSFGDTLLDSMGSSMPIPEDLVIELKLDTDGQKSRIDCNLYAEDVLILGIAMSSKITSGGMIKVPASYADASDSEAMQAWADAVNFEAVLDNLRSAGVPSDVVDLLKQSIENAMSGSGAYDDPVFMYPGYGY